MNMSPLVENFVSWYKGDSDTSVYLIYTGLLVWGGRPHPHSGIGYFPKYCLSYLELPGAVPPNISRMSPSPSPNSRIYLTVGTLLTDWLTHSVSLIHCVRHLHDTLLTYIHNTRYITWYITNSHYSLIPDCHLISHCHLHDGTRQTGVHCLMWQLFLKE